MTWEQIATSLARDLERHQEYLTWALLGLAFFAGLSLLTAIRVLGGREDGP